MRLLFAGILGVLFLSCLHEPDCISTATNLMRISLRMADVDSARTILFSSVTASGTDTVFYENDSISSLSLPVNPGTAQTIFKFYYDLEVDSMVVAYTRKTVVISPGCGAFNYFQELSIISTSFPTVTVLNPQLSTSGSANIEIKL